MTEKSKQQEAEEKSAKVESKWIYRGRIIALRSDTLHLPGMSPKVMDFVTHPGAVVIIPVMPNGDLILVKQWRRAAGKIMIELPAGTLEENEEPIICAQRELQEEAGYKAKEMVPFGGFYSAPGFCSEYLYLFIGKDLVESSLPHDDTEAIDRLFVDLDTAMQMIEDNQIDDAKTVAGILRYSRWRKSHGS